MENILLRTDHNNVWCTVVVFFWRDTLDTTNLQFISFGGFNPCWVVATCSQYVAKHRCRDHHDAAGLRHATTLRHSAPRAVPACQGSVHAGQNNWSFQQAAFQCGNTWWSLSKIKLDLKESRICWEQRITATAAMSGQEQLSFGLPCCASWV